MYARKKGMTLLLAAILPPSLSLTAQSALASDDGRGATRGVAQLAAAWFRWQETNFGTANFDFGEGLVDCSVGQRGDVWFLGGSDGSQPVERECIRRIPKKTRLFFPLVNLVFFNEPVRICPCPKSVHCSPASWTTSKRVRWPQKAAG